MSPRRPVHLLLAGALAAAGCSGGGAAAPPPRTAATPAAIRTVVEFGPDDVAVAVIERIGPDARASVRTPAGLLGEEIFVGDDHYVRMHAAEDALGIDRWIHTDLSDPAQRRYHRANPAGFVDLADLTERRVGDDVAGHEVLRVRHPRDGVVVLDLGEGRTVELRVEVVDRPGVEPIRPPEPEDVVALADLPELLAGRG